MFAELDELEKKHMTPLKGKLMKYGETLA